MKAVVVAGLFMGGIAGASDGAGAAQGGTAKDVSRLRTAAIAGLLLLPSETGIHGREQHGVDFLIGWAWQVPFGFDGGFNHRLVGSVGVLPAAADGIFRGRVGYRYSRRSFFTGAGASFDAGGSAWSLEIAFKFLHFNLNEQVISPSFHVLLRPEIDPGFQAMRGVTVLLGWNVF